MDRPNRWLDAGIWLSAGLLLVMFYPGGMSIDSYTQLGQARSGQFGDWHPPVMAWLWRGADAIVRGPLLMLVGQLALFLISLTMFSKEMIAGGRRARKLFVLLTLWITPISGIIGVVWKDVWTSCLLLLAIAFNVSISRGGGPAPRLRRFLWGALAILCALLFRYNAVLAAVPLLIYGAWELGRKLSSMVWRAVVAVLAGLAATAALVGVGAGINRSLTTRNEFPIQSILIFDIAGVSVLTGRTDFLDTASRKLPEVLRGQRSVPIEALRSSYYPSTWTPLVWLDGSPLAVSTSRAEVDELAAVWSRAVLEEPRAYLTHRLHVFEQVIGAHQALLFAPVYFAIPRGSPDYALASRSFQIETNIAPTQDVLRDAVAVSATLFTYRPWFWLGLNVLLIGVAVRVSSRRTALVAIGSSGLLYELALLFLAPSADYRYSHWLVLSTWVLLAALVSEVAPRLIARFSGSRREVS